MKNFTDVIYFSSTFVSLDGVTAGVGCSQLVLSSHSQLRGVILKPNFLWVGKLGANPAKQTGFSNHVSFSCVKIFKVGTCFPVTPRDQTLEGGSLRGTFNADGAMTMLYHLHVGGVNSAFCGRIIVSTRPDSQTCAQGGTTCIAPSALRSPSYCACDCFMQSSCCTACSRVPAVPVVRPRGDGGDAAAAAPERARRTPAQRHHPRCGRRAHPALPEPVR